MHTPLKSTNDLRLHRKSNFLNARGQRGISRKWDQISTPGVIRMACNWDGGTPKYFKIIQKSRSPLYLVPPDNRVSCGWACRRMLRGGFQKVLPLSRAYRRTPYKGTCAIISGTNKMKKMKYGLKMLSFSFCLR